MKKYFATHIQPDGQWIGYGVKKELAPGVYRDVAVVYHKKTLKTVLAALNGETDE